jgi:hypothetical protein
MKHNPSRKANNHSESQEASGLLWNLNAHYRVHRSSSLVPDGSIEPKYLKKLYQMQRLFSVEGCECVSGFYEFERITG